MSSSLWWQLVSNGVQPVSSKVPMTTPVWRLMRDDVPVLSASIAALQSSSWAGEGATPFVKLIEDTDPFDSPPFVSGTFRQFCTESASFRDTFVDPIIGFSTLSLQCIDAANSWFAPSESFGMSVDGANYGILPSTFSLQISASDFPAGPYFVAIAATGSLTVFLHDVALNYATTTGSIVRLGVVINAETGSAQLSMEPVGSDPLQLLPGDVWFRTGSTGDTNLIFADADVTGTIYRARVLASRVGETTSSLASRFGTSDAPTGSILGVNSVVSDNWLMTINTPASVGAGWQNFTWGGGIYMPDANTVAVWSRSGSAHNFLIPSGSLIVRNSITIQSGSFNLLSGSLTIVSGNLTLTSGSLVIQDRSGTILLSGSNSQFVISGSNADILLRGTPVMTVLTGSVNSSSLNASIGTLYINTGTLPPQISLRTATQWMDFSVLAPILVDGGFF